jgi:putative ABC transport system substrate-binding protein
MNANFSCITRRQLTVALGGAAAWPISARGEQAKPVIGYLTVTSREKMKEAAFHRGLNEVGFSEGRNVDFEYRSADGNNQRLGALAADLVKRHVTVIAALGGPTPALAAKAATSTIPIVFQTGSDPVRDGLVASLNRPGGNVTGASRVAVAVGRKSLDLLHEAAPKATAIALLLNPRNPIAMFQVRELEWPASSLGLSLQILRASTERELETAFTGLPRLGPAGLVVANDPFLMDRTNRVVALAAQYKVPAIYSDREQAVAGGLMSYGPSVEDSFRQAGVQVGHVLKGGKPADLPVLLPEVFEFVVNLKTAKSLGLDIPPKLQKFAHEVIE